jgi:hypothetical protein
MGPFSVGRGYNALSNLVVKVKGSSIILMGEGLRDPSVFMGRFRGPQHNVRWFKGLRYPHSGKIYEFQMSR